MSVFFALNAFHAMNFPTAAPYLQAGIEAEANTRPALMNYRPELVGWKALHRDRRNTAAIMAVRAVS